jgi:hypothetical protein
MIYWFLTEYFYFCWRLSSSTLVPSVVYGHTHSSVKVNWTTAVLVEPRDRLTFRDLAQSFWPKQGTLRY